MKKRVFSIMGLSFLLAAFALSVVPAQAQNVDEKIKVLEQELMQLKSEQIELRKDATTAAAALPEFSYRTGRGLLIQAADKSWGIRFWNESHFRVDFEEGRAQAGRTNGEVFARRFRPYINYCIQDCFYETEMGLDLDGFGTGNAKNSTNSATSSILQRAIIYVHFEKINPWLPLFEFGADLTGIGVIPYRQGGNNEITAQAEYDLLSRNNGFNTGRAGTGFILRWDDMNLSGIGIPGRARTQVAMASTGEGDDGLSSFKDQKNFNYGIQIEPFTQVKNKWISGLGFSFNSFFCNTVRPSSRITASTPDNGGCNRNRVQDDGDNGRQTLFDGGTQNGRGMSLFLAEGLSWFIGPYHIYGYMGQQHYGSTNGESALPTGIGQKAHNFLIGHELFVWSPKGFLTGSSNDAGSILFGTHYEHYNSEIGCAQSNSCAAFNGGQFHRISVLVREWDLFYFLGPRHSVGINVQWYDASNLRTGAGQAGTNLGQFKVSCTTDCRGKGGDWTAAMLNWRLNF